MSSRLVFCLFSLPRCFGQEHSYFPPVNLDRETVRFIFMVAGLPFLVSAFSLGFMACKWPRRFLQIVEDPHTLWESALRWLGTIGTYLIGFAQAFFFFAWVPEDPRALIASSFGFGFLFLMIFLAVNSASGVIDNEELRKQIRLLQRHLDNRL